jgi:hypothetical protein
LVLGWRLIVVEHSQATAPAKSKGGGFKVKKDEYSGNKKIAVCLMSSAWE